MKRRAFITLLGGAAAWPLAARAQQGKRMRRIGVLMGDPTWGFSPPPDFAPHQQVLPAPGTSVTTLSYFAEVTNLD